MHHLCNEKLLQNCKHSAHDASEKMVMQPCTDLKYMSSIATLPYWRVLLTQHRWRTIRLCGSSIEV